MAFSPADGMSIIVKFIERNNYIKQRIKQIDVLIVFLDDMCNKQYICPTLI